MPRVYFQSTPDLSREIHIQKSRYNPCRRTRSLDVVWARRRQLVRKLEAEGAESPTQEPERESWDNKFQFLLATIGYAVGLGSVWRFPYLTQRNGGGAFLIPFFIMLFILGIPVFYLELAVGQRLRKGAIGVWNQVSPYLGGIGMASCFVSLNVALYYNTIIAWCLYYMFHSFSAHLPWSECPKEYFPNKSYVINEECEASSPTEYFWYRQTLDISEDVNSPEAFNWHICSCLVVAWVLTYLCMAKGIASSGKVVYVTATFPYVVLFIFFVRGMLLDGMQDGLRHLFTPDFKMLIDPVVWLEAGTQIFFSFGLGFGGLIAFSSYNPPNNNVFRDAVAIGLLNAGTAMFASIVVFSVLGFKAHNTHNKCLHQRELELNASLVSYLGVSGVTTAAPEVTVPPEVYNRIFRQLRVCDLDEELANSSSGTGLAFIVFTEAINQFPAAPFWSVLFFLMLFTLGIDSEFGTLEGVITSIVDLKLFPNLRKEILTGIICIICCLLSMVFAHGAGNYLFILFDDFSGNLPLLIIALSECIGIAWVYGLRRFCDDIEMMTGKRPHWYWMFCWKYLSPFTMIVILVASIIKTLMDGAGYQAWDAEAAVVVTKLWPHWAWGVICVLVLVSALWLPGVAIAKFFGINVIPPEEAAWFPVADMREMHHVKPHKVTELERTLFAMHPDGSEGFCLRSPPYEDEETAVTAIGELEDPWKATIRSSQESRGGTRSAEEP
ncbi:sodium-dependent neutral amino acid transporter B(0)AT3-like [Amphibalanus amphitrite]|uniref:sodium-dependent neutral amino acid transporter B(0)AT3-like n=1 Tax=Amphibalanus amphitrite TaxID=1232801 RepID=UPI001C908BAB|nr:sodium-dependent neutral amino acid transporter B(0)AT3-like [Amphibalanus amphitrite]